MSLQTSADDAAAVRTESNPPVTTSDQAAFEDSFTRHYSRVYQVLFRLTGNRAEAEDLALETFWRLWQRAPAMPNPAAWLYRVATNLGYNALRATRRRTHYEDAAAQLVWQTPASPDPLSAAERAAERARVQATLGRLRSRDAQILVLRHSVLSYREIADALGVSPNSVGALLARAEKEFEKHYAALE